MAEMIELKTFTDLRGSLTVIEKDIPFVIKRIYYIYGVHDRKIIRAGHRHKKNIQALVCVAGSCEIFVNNGIKKQTFRLDRPDKCLLIRPEDWHTLQDFSKDSILLVLASEPYDINDYIDEKYHD